MTDTISHQQIASDLICARVSAEIAANQGARDANRIRCIEAALQNTRRDVAALDRVLHFIMMMFVRGAA